jgi:hypothetical protein
MLLIKITISTQKKLKIKQKFQINKHRPSIKKLLSKRPKEQSYCSLCLKSYKILKKMQVKRNPLLSKVLIH